MLCVVGCLSQSQHNQLTALFLKLAATKTEPVATPEECAEMKKRLPLVSSPVIEEDNEAECRRLCAYNLPVS